MPVKKKAPARKKKTTTRRKTTAKPKKTGGKTRYRPRTKRGGKKATWGAVAPKTTAERRKIKAKCGSKCFAGSNLSYPICTSRSCVPDPRGIEAARSRAKQFDHRKGAVGKRARAVLRKIGK